MNTSDAENIPGLSQAEAADRLVEEGYNELPAAQKRQIWHIALEVVREPMFLLLLSCGILYLLSGEVQEAMMLLGFVFVVMGITFYQERKSERALEALRDLSSPLARVIRDGEKMRIPGREVVREDILMLREGDRVPADAVILDCMNLSADESLLTGESVPVRKSKSKENSPQTAAPGGDDQPFVYSGSLIVGGQGIAQVLHTGAETEIGKIGKALRSLEPEDTPLQQQTAKLVRNLAFMGLMLCILVVVVFGLTRGDWLHAFLAGLSLAMAMLPEEFPVVLTIFLAIGAWRISQHNVLTRRVPAVETLGSATVLCVDKTGTLTMNRMTVSDLYANGRFMEVSANLSSLPEEFHKVVEYSLLASPADPFDPMEKAMKELGISTLAHTEHLHKDWILQREYPLSQELLAMSRVWRSPEGKDYIIAAKGAPEAIADLCHFSPEQTKDLLKAIDDLSSLGRRVIAVASARFRKSRLPGEQHAFHFTFEGLLGLTDPLRPGVKEAIAECYTAGIRTIMITGDYPGTARNIALQLGLKNPDECITGPELAQMDTEELARRVREVNIFARMVPAQKLGLVEALKKNREVVAMTGDGVNDAPALKAAHIGIAMGGRGTDVAREAASLVLLDDDFSSIVKAVKMGRRIFANLRKAMRYIFSVHIPIAGMSLIPVLFEWPLALFPVHIVFLELIIDPACSIVFEAEEAEKNCMEQPPRNIGEPLFGKQAVLISMMQGMVILGAVIVIYWWALSIHGDQSARALAFMTLVISNLALIFTNRSETRSILATIREPNKALWCISGATILMLIVVMTLPFFHALFQFCFVRSADIGYCLLAGFVCILILEFLKTPFMRRVLGG
ncbi:MAG: cation-translocating P-type ATPase [Desulfococcaceae bacterium]